MLFRSNAAVNEDAARFFPRKTQSIGTTLLLQVRLHSYVSPPLRASVGLLISDWLYSNSVEVRYDRTRTLHHKVAAIYDANA